jgi:hypothetical protein
MKKHLVDQQDQLKKIMEGIHTDQMKQLKENHVQETKDLRTTQVKENIDLGKNVQADKSLKSKGDRSRRLREKKQTNIKRFMEEKKV